MRPEASRHIAPVTADPLRYAAAYHAPVLWQEVVERLVTDSCGTYVDGTMGGGGHTAALLDALLPEGRVVGVDQDAEAIAEAASRLSGAVESGRLLTLRGNFGDLQRLLAETGIEGIDGLLLDLGVSSHQVDAPERGFSYMGTGELDMRMDQRAGITAADVVNDWDPAELRRLLKSYGDEPRARRLALAIAAARPLDTTADLAAVVRREVPRSDEIKTLSRVFQAIRIVVNGELERLEQALVAGLQVLRSGGRMAVISYHSLEDRRVKRFFRYGNLEGKPVHDFFGNLVTPWKDLTRRPIEAGDAERAANPRARSARLRVAEKVPPSAPDAETHL